MFSFNFCPNCRSSHITFTNQQRLECDDCGMIFYQNVAAAVAVLIEQNDRLLFTVRNQEPAKGKLDLPGGFTDPDERMEETCSRELKEELNIEIAPDDFTYFYSEPNTYLYKDITYKTADAVFLAKLPGTTSIRLEEAEIQAVKWIEKSAVNLDEIAFPSLRKAVKRYLEAAKE